MWAAGAGFSVDPDAAAGAREAAEQAVAASGGAEAALVFAGPAHRGAAQELVDVACDVLDTRRVVGCLAHGVIGAGREQEGGAAVSVLAVRGLEAQTLWLPDLADNEDLVGDELERRLGGFARPEDLVVLIPDPRALHPERLLASVRDAVGPAGVVGAGAGDPVSEAPLVWCGSELGTGALTGLVLRGARARRIGVTQACRPATPLFTVTRCQPPWILELDGRAALDVYRETAGEPLARDLARAAATVLVALPRDAAAPLEPGGYLVRNVAGFAPDASAFAVAEAIAEGSQLALVYREPEAARADLKALLDRLAGDPPGLALYFDCCARGAGFFGVPGLETAYLERAFGGGALAGMFGSCELGPVGGQLELLTYTGVVALLDR